MIDIRHFLKSGHGPTLFAAFFYLTFSFVIWVLNGAMAPFISEQFQLTPAQKGTLLAIPIMAGAIMRFPLGLLAQYVGRKTATLVELSLIAFTMAFGYFFVHSYDEVAEDGPAAGGGRRQLRRGHVAGLGLVPEIGRAHV